MEVIQSDTAKNIRIHIHRVQYNLLKLVNNLRYRAETHDKSKLEEPEKSGFEAMDEYPRQKYGTEGYYQKLNYFAPVLEHHYQNNSHHPEHYYGFIHEMDLLDIIEMVCDWMTYKEELTSFEAIELVEQQAKRFNLSSELSAIILNTYKRYLTSEPDLI